MTSIVISTLNIWSINKEERFSEYLEHKSHPANFFNSKDLLKNRLPLIFEIYRGLIEEYISTLGQVLIFGFLLYFTLTSLSFFYFFIWKKQKFLPKYQGTFYIIHDIKWSSINILIESLLVSALKMFQIRYSFVYFKVSDYGYMYLILSILLHVAFDETFTYWIHRIFHTNRTLYRLLHKIHHKSVDVTPFSAFAFHPIDAFGQAFPTFTSCFFFPLHYDVMLFFSFITSCWAISIHDNVPAMPLKLFLYSTHHTIHHEEGMGKFRNYGKFTSVWDRLAGTYSDPDRINYGWQRNQKVKNFFDHLNEIIDKYIPDRTPRYISKKRN